MKFPWRIIGHQKILEKLEQEFETKHLAHAYLFCGPKEIGKFGLVKTFAELLQCEEHNMCRNCDTCERIEKNIHPHTIVVDRLWIKDKNEDLEELAQYSNFDQNHRKKSGKRSDQIGIGDVLEFTKSLWQKAESNFKICLICDMERMTEEAMNTFLKTLEEPPEKTIFLLTTTHRDSLLPTITSRIQSIEMSLVPNSVLRKYLESEATELSSEQQEKLLTLAQGRPSRLVRFLQDRDFLQSQDELFHTLSKLMSSKNIPELFTIAQKLAKPDQDAELNEFLDGLIHFLRTLLREKKLEKSLSLGTQLSTEQLLNALEKTETVATQITKNVNKRLALEQLMLSL